METANSEEQQVISNGLEVSENNGAEANNAGHQENLVPKVAHSHSPPAVQGSQAVQAVPGAFPNQVMSYNNPMPGYHHCHCYGHCRGQVPNTVYQNENSLDLGSLGTLGNFSNLTLSGSTLHLPLGGSNQFSSIPVCQNHAIHSHNAQPVNAAQPAIQHQNNPVNIHRMSPAEVEQQQTQHTQLKIQQQPQSQQAQQINQNQHGQLDEQQLQQNLQHAQRYQQYMQQQNQQQSQNNQHQIQQGREHQHFQQNQQQSQHNQHQIQQSREHQHVQQNHQQQLRQHQHKHRQQQDTTNQQIMENTQDVDTTEHQNQMRAMQQEMQGLEVDQYYDGTFPEYRSANKREISGGYTSDSAKNLIYFQNEYYQPQSARTQRPPISIMRSDNVGNSQSMVNLNSSPSKASLRKADIKVVPLKSARSVMAYDQRSEVQQESEPVTQKRVEVEQIGDGQANDMVAKQFEKVESKMKLLTKSRRLMSEQKSARRNGLDL